MTSNKEFADIMARAEERQAILKKAYIKHHPPAPINGVHIEWHNDNQKESEVNYKDGKKEGLEIQWHDNGNKKLEVNYTNGKREGLLTEWHYGARVAFEGNYSKGKEDGFHIEYYNDYNNSFRHGVFFKDGNALLTHSDHTKPTPYAIHNIRDLINDKVLSFNVDNSSPEFSKRFTDFFTGAFAPGSQIASILESNRPLYPQEPIVDVFDKTIHDNFMAKMDNESQPTI